MQSNGDLKAIGNGTTAVIADCRFTGLSPRIQLTGKRFGLKNGCMTDEHYNHLQQKPDVPLNHYRGCLELFLIIRRSRGLN